MVKKRRPNLKPTNSKLRIAPLGEYSLANHRKLPKLPINYPAAVSRSTFLLIIAALLAAHAQAAQVTIIDQFSTLQTNTSYNSSTSNTIAVTPGSAVGNFRTMTLTSVGNEINDEQSTLRIQTNAAGGGPRMVLSSGNDVSATYEIKWGGAGGTNGLGGIDFRGGISQGNFSLTNSTLNFSLYTADLVSPFTWTFTDTSNVSAVYSSLFPSNPPSTNTVPVPYNISLASFANATSINWSAIDLIVLSGGGTNSLDLTLTAPISLTAVPEPQTWALVATGLGLATLVFRRKASRPN